jgi:endonuclease I
MNLVRPSRQVCALAVVIVGYCWTASAIAGPPVGYYDSVDASSTAVLRATLHAVIDDHTKIPYTAGSTDTWNVLEIAQENPSNASQIIDVYKNAAYTKVGAGNSFYNREHSWPKSYGFPNDGSGNYPYTDLYQLFLSNDSYNSSRNNKIFDDCTAGCSEQPTDANNGEGGGSGTYPGNSNWTDSDSWEVWIGRRGDIARAMFYLDVRYEGGTHAVTGFAEPDLILTDNETLINNSNTGSNELIAYMGLLSVLYQWHLQDPVDALELARNDTVYIYQGNRNPFVDHPEWADCLFDANCSGDALPATPMGLTANGTLDSVLLDWDDNVEPEADLDGYNILRSTNAGGPYSQLNGALLPTSDYVDFAVTSGITYHYVVTAVDLAANESDPSAEALAAITPAPGSGDPWINELHYDDSGPDEGEFVEIAGPVGFNLNGWSLIGYNGADGTSYGSVALSGPIPDQGECIGTMSFAFIGLQNDAPDGLALVDPNNTVILFLSYEGAFTATDGPANGIMSVDIGVSEDPPPPAGYSLQLGGTGTKAEHFFWQSFSLETAGAVNNNQTFTSCNCPGDTDGNGAVNISDLGNVLANFGLGSGATRAQGDLDGDGDVDITDLGILLSNFGVPCN